MTPYERVFNRLSKKPVDKIPNLNIIMAFAAKYLGVKYSDYVKNNKYLVDANIKCCDDFGIDMVSAISDSCRELSDFGAEVIYPDYDAPFCKNNFIKKYSDLKKITVGDPLNSERMLDRLKAIELYNKKVKGYYPILGWVEGAFAEAVGLRGMNNIMMDLIDNPDFVRELLEICREQAIIFAAEQVKMGADFIGIGDAAASLIGPAYYKEFALPHEMEIIKTIHNLGAKAKLHICGNISPILDLVVVSGADMIDIDWMVDFKKSVEIFNDKASACGNFDPVKIMLNGSPEDVRDAVHKCVKAGQKNTFIAAGCEVPKDTPLENMKMVNAALVNIS